MKKIIVSFCASLILLAGCSNLPEKAPEINIKLNNKDYLLETAKNQEQVERGLMFRNSLDFDRGMIFYFNKPDYLNFWMKNTYLPLQIIFIKGCEIVDIQEMTVEKNPANPEKKYQSKELSDKAIELNAHTIDANLIGSRIEELCN